ncbi:hypothetical protein [Hymenobacter latericus]|uniref:hypothetical protein n=1 Tax=Hymenobacter sp. YIM 151858-1 TaxID=2987688 RepID=UPI0022275DA7|nr:hypothetical protein [Hymenobacter sp. YIM 151858-1]UYZ58155.1 hypothetical protein OIS50_13935 [Hymenobacter sp. YIM 151858-1]
MRSYLLALSLVLGARLASGQSPLFQPGYIVRAGAPADTVRGYLDVYRATTRLGYIRFQATPEAPVEKLRARHLLAAGTADLRQAFRSRQLSGDSLRLLEVVASGPLSVYTGYVANSPADYLLGEADKPLLPLARPQFLPVLQGVVANCPTLNLRDRKRARLQYGRQPIGQVVTEYNRCATPAATARYYPGSGMQRLHFGAQGGVQHSRFWLVEKDMPFGNQRPTTTSYTAGASLVWVFSGHLQAALEVNYSRLGTTAQVRERPNAANNYFLRTAELELEALQIPLLGRWQFGRPERRLHLYAEGGGTHIQVLSYRARVSETPEVATDRPYAYNLSMNANSLASRFGAGLTYRSKLGRWGLAAHRQSALLAGGSKTQYRLQQNTLVLTLGL